jgi:predicted Zn-dependent protease
MTRLLGVLVGVLLFSNCAAIRSAMRSTGVDQAVDRSVGSDVRAFAGKLETCDKLESMKASYEEEVGIGGAVALNLAGRTNGVYVEISPELASSMPRPNVKPKPGKGPKTDLTAYINRIGKGMAAASSRPGLDWTFVVLDSPTPNAFSAPGGYVFITTGMIAAVDNEAQLAAILGHEIGHVTGRHSMVAYSKTKAGSCRIAIPLGYAKDAAREAVSLAREFEALTGGTPIDLNKASADLVVKLSDGLADELVSRGNGPDFEHEADAVAYELMVFAGYDPAEFEKLLAKLPDGGFLTPHPKNAARIAKLAPLKADYASFANGLKVPALDAVAKVLKK